MVFLLCWLDFHPLVLFSWACLRVWGCSSVSVCQFKRVFVLNLLKREACLFGFVVWGVWLVELGCGVVVLARLGWHKVFERCFCHWEKAGPSAASGRDFFMLSGFESAALSY